MYGVGAGIPISKVTAGPNEIIEKKKKELKKACQDFESIFVSQLWKQMYDNAEMTEKTGLGYKVMRDVAIEKSAESLCASGGVGLWKVLYDDLSKTLERKQSIRNEH